MIKNKSVIFYLNRESDYIGEMDNFEKVIADLIERDWIYEKDGAFWMRTTKVGDDKDRVVIRSRRKSI